MVRLRLSQQTEQRSSFRGLGSREEEAALEAGGLGDPPAGEVAEDAGRTPTIRLLEREEAALEAGGLGGWLQLLGRLGGGATVRVSVGGGYCWGCPRWRLVGGILGSLCGWEHTVRRRVDVTQRGSAACLPSTRHLLL